MLGNHSLSTRCYLGKQSKWDVEETKCTSEGKPLPFKEIKEPVTRGYFRSLVMYDKKTGLYYFKDKSLAKMAQRVVINL